jgi:hypothetical protein
MMKRGLGWLPDLQRGPNQRGDWTFGSQIAKMSAPPPIPQAHSNRRLVLDVLDQGPLNTCVPCAGFQAIRMAAVRQGAKTPLLGARLFAYYLARSAVGQAKYDGGISFRSFFWALHQYGFIAERDFMWGYDVERVNEAPPTAAYQRAYDLRSPTRYWAIEQDAQRIELVKRAIATGYGVCIGLMVDQDFLDWRVDPTTPLDPPSAANLSVGHAMLLEGYDGDAFTVVNSWGKGFGNEGRCLISAEYVNDAPAIWVVEQAPRSPPKRKEAGHV